MQRLDPVCLPIVFKRSFFSVVSCDGEQVNLVVCALPIEHFNFDLRAAWEQVNLVDYHVCELISRVVKPHDWQPNNGGLTSRDPGSSKNKFVQQIPRCNNTRCSDQRKLICIGFVWFFCSVDCVFSSSEPYIFGGVKYFGGDAEHPLRRRDISLRKGKGESA